jgi:hypothetical protein
MYILIVMGINVFITKQKQRYHRDNNTYFPKAVRHPDLKLYVSLTQGIPAATKVWTSGDWGKKDTDRKQSEINIFSSEKCNNRFNIANIVSKGHASEKYFNVQ